jgi:hypothetical protein
MIHTWNGDLEYVANPMDPVEVRGLLEVGGLYEFRNTYATWPMLGHFRGFSGVDFKFKLFYLIACDCGPSTPIIEDVSIHETGFKYLKRVSFEELPLYIGWSWKSDRFIQMLKGL